MTAQPELSESAKSPAPALRVMYVDNDAPLALLITKRLARIGYAAISETDPLVALEKIRKDPESLDALITDISMPHMTGFQLARAVISIRPELPIFMMSGFFNETDKGVAQGIGVQEIIPKRATVDELHRVLSEFFSTEKRILRA
jgi:DNA-binding response OmpR family regulator